MLNLLNKKRSSTELLVPGIGLEPTRLSALAPETSASTISPSGLATAKVNIFSLFPTILQLFFVFRGVAGIRLLK